MSVQLHNKDVNLFNDGKYRDAMLVFANMLRANHNNSQLWNDWASAMAASGQVEAALKGFEHALELDPNNREAATNIAALIQAMNIENQASKPASTEDMRRTWNFGEKRSLLYALVGYDFGMEPENKLDEIREYKRKESAFLQHVLKPTKEDVMLDLGSGCGFIARVFAPLCKQIYCLDISSEFLDFTREELAQFPNVGYHRMPFADLHFLDDKKVTKGYSNAVFIHFNFFDVVAYLQEIYRVLANGGLFLFGLSNTDNLDLKNDKYFNLVKGNYLKDRSSIPTCMQWNSSYGVCNAARQIGFEAGEVWVGSGSSMILVRKP